jgi:hypothetical protein
MASAGSGTAGLSATTAIRTRLRLPRTTRLVLRTSMVGSEGKRLGGWRQVRCTRFHVEQQGRGEGISPFAAEYAQQLSLLPPYSQKSVRGGVAPPRFSYVLPIAVCMGMEYR